MNDTPKAPEKLNWLLKCKSINQGNKQGIRRKEATARSTDNRKAVASAGSSERESDSGIWRAGAWGLGGRSTCDLEELETQMPRSRLLHRMGQGSGPEAQGQVHTGEWRWFSTEGGFSPENVRDYLEACLIVTA